jgi:hypothetical protein
MLSHALYGWIYYLDTIGNNNLCKLHVLSRKTMLDIYYNFIKYLSNNVGIRGTPD